MTSAPALSYCRGLMLTGGALLIAACQYLEPMIASGPGSAALPPVEDRSAQVYHLDAQRSVIQLRVYRDGLLARLGHNHIIAATQISGTLYKREPLTISSFALTFPVAGLVVDRPGDRRRAGADFPGELSKAQIDGTRRNMLGPQVLAGDRFPVVTLHSVAMEGKLPTPVWRVAVKVRDRVSELRVPVHVTSSGGQLIVQGALKLSQRELGMQPFCVLGGKLCVRDDIDAEFYLVAVPGA